MPLLILTVTVMIAFAIGYGLRNCISPRQQMTKGFAGYLAVSLAGVTFSIGAGIDTCYATFVWSGIAIAFWQGLSRHDVWD
ncbi:hypothetical protein GTO89_12115 [Heliobacterium gestii]|uniref:Uncharacterized protein n=1 Tax=Heliomicrobium gestii TaxID=2699 RepID=A0A845LGS0_HELGE|nr:hypothetical protein [Heliomicrobium gestii]MBM7867234.1 hypothetical protein [Heliomicrobium gestii]MZP43789.1 hypothetical protein [Heliomicrobium gestii]